MPAADDFAKSLLVGELMQFRKQNQWNSNSIVAVYSLFNLAFRFVYLKGNFKSAVNVVAD
jgi:hypothetical protein